MPPRLGFMESSLAEREERSIGAVEAVEALPHVLQVAVLGNRCARRTLHARIRTPETPVAVAQTLPLRTRTGNACDCRSGCRRGDAYAEGGRPASACVCACALRLEVRRRRGVERVVALRLRGEAASANGEQQRHVQRARLSRCSAFARRRRTCASSAHPHPPRAAGTEASRRRRSERATGRRACRMRARGTPARTRRLSLDSVETFAAQSND